MIIEEISQIFSYYTWHLNLCLYTSFLHVKHFEVQMFQLAKKNSSLAFL